MPRNTLFAVSLAFSSPELEDKLSRLEQRITALEKVKPLEKLFYDLKETAHMLNVSVSTVRRYKKEGLLAYSKVDHKVQVPAQSIKDFSRVAIK